MIFGTAHVKGVDAMRELIIAVDSPLIIDHHVLEFWDGGEVKIIAARQCHRGLRYSFSGSHPYPSLTFLFIRERSKQSPEVYRVAGPFDTL